MTRNEFSFGCRPYFFQVSIAGPIEGVEEARRRIRVSSQSELGLYLSTHFFPAVRCVDQYCNQWDDKNK